MKIICSWMWTGAESSVNCFRKNWFFQIWVIWLANIKTNFAINHPIKMLKFGKLVFYEINLEMILHLGALSYLMWLKQHPSFDWQKSLIVVLNLSPTDTYIRKLQLALSISNQWLKDVVQKNQTGGINSEIKGRNKL